VVDSYGLQLSLTITGGEVNDCSAAPRFDLPRLPDGGKPIVADKGYDSDCYTGADNKEGG